MADSLTQVQREFVHLLKGLGCSLLETLVISARLADPSDLADMLDWMADNPDSTPEELLRISSQIYSKSQIPKNRATMTNVLGVYE